MQKIAVYGSLKKGKYNHSLLAESKFIGDTQVKGTLYSVSSYPALLDEGKNYYPAEIYEVSEDTYQRIRSMELGAGYKEVDIDGVIVYYAGVQLATHCREFKKIISEY